MAFNYPWTNLHELNLSWIVNQVKSMATKFKNVTASAETLEPSEEATVTVTESSNGFAFAFGIPRGASGSGNVTSVNGKTGVVVLDADDVGALPDDTDIPTKTSDLTNDSGFITDDTLDDYRTSAAQDVIDATKQATLVSGSNIKTINNNSILGSGNIEITGTGAVSSVNGQTGEVVLTAANVNALPSSTTTLPNPNALTFTGGDTGTYDGSTAVSINIPNVNIQQQTISLGASAGTASGSSYVGTLDISSVISGLTSASKIWLGGFNVNSLSGGICLCNARIYYSSGWKMTWGFYNGSGGTYSSNPEITLFYIA